MPRAAASTRRTHRAASPDGADRRRISKNKQTPRPIEPDDLRRFQLVSDPQVAPDGTRIVFAVKTVGESNEYHTNLWIAPTDGSGDPDPFTTGNRDTTPQWSHDGSRIAFIRKVDKHKPQLWIIPASGGEAQPLTDLPEGTISSFQWSPDGSTLAVCFREQDPDFTKQAAKHRDEHNLSTPPRVIDDPWYRLDGDGYFNAQRFHLLLVDGRTGEHRTIYDKDTLGVFSYDFSPDGREIALTTNRDPRALLRPWKMQVARLNVRTGKVTPLKNLPEGPKTAVKWSPDGTSIAWAGRADRDALYSPENMELFVCNVDGTNARSLTAETDYCLMAATAGDTAEMSFAPALRWSPDSSRLYTQIGWHGETHIASVPRQGGRITFHTEGPSTVTLGTFSDDGRTLGLTVGDATSLDEIHVARVPKSSKPGRFKVTRCSNFNGPLLAELDVAAPESHWIESADGTPVQVWSLKPAGFKRNTKYPAVLEIHGGPHAQYGATFFHEFQVLAAAGYAVFYANPRGSKGYGRDFCAAIRGSWGEKDWEDIQAVTDFMQRQPHVDTSRMGVMGGSYGGFMTNWVIGHTDVFAGAITDRCVANLVSMAGTSDILGRADQYWPGNWWDRIEPRWDHSPIKYLANAVTPTLIIHSEGDLRCNVEQAEQVFAILSYHDVPCRFVRYPRESSHGLSRGGPPDLRLHRLDQILQWWRTYLLKRTRTTSKAPSSSPRRTRSRAAKR